MSAAPMAGVAGRVLLLAVLGLALADPPLPVALQDLHDPRTAPVDLVIVQEASPDATRFWTPGLRDALDPDPRSWTPMFGGTRSAPGSWTPMSGPDRAQGDDSQGKGNESWTPTFGPVLARLLATLPAGSRVAAVRFGDAAGVLFGLTPAERAPLGRVFANAGAREANVLMADASLGAALDAAVHLADPGRRLDVVVLAHGDLAATGAEAALLRARRAGVATRWHDLRGEPPPPGVHVADIHAPRQVRAGEAVPVSVALSGGGSGTLQLLVDGRLEREQDVDAGAAPRWRLPALPPGTHLLRARMAPVGAQSGAIAGAPAVADAGDSARDTLVRVAAPPTVLYVSRDPAPPLLRSLRGGNWPVVAVAPGRLADGLDGSPAAVVLDDVPLSSLSAAALDELLRQVRGEGLGLLVLGGPSSFAAGAYRGSRLEELLPVTSEGARPGGTVAVLFLVDTSGSMGRETLGDSREGRARRAVVEAAAGIAPGDLSGVYTYDITLRRTLPLAPRARAADELRAALRSAGGASGGTRLAPALSVALADLARADATQKILVLVTDGHLASTEDLAPAEARIVSEGIQVVPVVIGGNAEVESLRRLARAGGGALLRVHQATELPRLLHQAMDAGGAGPPDTALRPVQAAPLPLLAPVTSWPTLRSYQMTRERPAATVYLRAPGGAPLLAAHQAGAGRVVALPGGLSGWAPAWTGWERFGELAAALLRQVATPLDNPRLQLQVSDAPGTLQLRVDVPEPRAEAVTVMLAPVPAGAGEAPREVALEALAPGRYGATVTGVRVGRHALTVRAGGESLRTEHLHRVVRDPATQALAPALAAGLVSRLEDGETRLPGAGSAQPLLIGAAALGYPLLLAAPWVGRLARRRLSGVRPA